MYLSPEYSCTVCYIISNGISLPRFPFLTKFSKWPTMCSNGFNQIDSLSENIILFVFYHGLILSMGSWQSVWYHANSIFNHTETINAVLSQSLYYISPIVYKGNNIFTNLIHVTTKTTRSSMATVLEQALTTMYAVLSFSVRKRKKE